jgi:hypothetical protein
MFPEIFGDSPQVKVIDLLITQDDLEYTKKEIAECAEVGRSTLYTFWETLERYEIVKKTRRIGNTWLYKINSDSPAVKALQEFQLRIVDIIVEEETKEKKRKFEKNCQISESNTPMVGTGTFLLPDRLKAYLFKDLNDLTP